MHRERDEGQIGRENITFRCAHHQFANVLDWVSRTNKFDLDKIDWTANCDSWTAYDVDVRLNLSRSLADAFVVQFNVYQFQPHTDQIRR